MTIDSSHPTLDLLEDSIHTTDDIDTLRRLLIDKERERVSLANDLNVAAHLGLVISETNEALHIKLEKVQQENRALQQAWATPREQLTLELDLARKDLDTFRLEMDGLGGQLVDMAAEIVESKTRVSVYAKRLAQVEHKLTTTRTMNNQLQSLLEKTLQSQQQSSSTTGHLVKNLQDDLIKVVTENNQLQNRIIELEQQQIQGEDHLSRMAVQAQEYADLLEQAQNTIHQLGEPQLEEDEEDNDLSTISSSTGYNEITKGAVFSEEFRQEMQKEIERNLQLRHDIRHRIITAEPIEKRMTRKTMTAGQGLKALIADRDPGLSDIASLSSSSSSSSSTTTTTTTTAAATATTTTTTTTQQHRRPRRTSEQFPIRRPTATPVLYPMNTLRPATNFLTGFADDPFKRPSFLAHASITRPRDPNEPSLSTRFFHRLASRFDEAHS